MPKTETKKAKKTVISDVKLCKHIDEVKSVR